MVGNHCRQFTKLTGPSVYTYHSNLISLTDKANGFCVLSHKFHKYVTNIFVILLLRSFTYPLICAMF